MEKSVDLFVDLDLSEIQKRIVIEVGSRDFRIAYPEVKDGRSSIRCRTFSMKSLDQLERLLSEFDDDCSVHVISNSQIFGNKGVETILQLIPGARTLPSEIRYRVEALRLLTESCRRQDWVYFVAFSPHHDQTLTYPQFYDLATSIFDGKQEVDDSALTDTPALLSIFDDVNQNIYIEQDRFTDMPASGFNSSYLMGMAKVLTNCESLEQYCECASSGSAMNTSTCLVHFPPHQYTIFDTKTMKDVYDGRTSYIVFPLSQYNAEKPFSREDCARTILRHTMDVVFFSAFSQARYNKVRSLFLAGSFQECFETVRQSVMTFLPMLDKLNAGGAHQLNVFIVKPASYLTVIGALIDKSQS